MKTIFISKPDRHLILYNTILRTLMLAICVCMNMSAYASKSDSLVQILDQLYEAKKYDEIISKVENLDYTQLSNEVKRTCSYYAGKCYYQKKETNIAIDKLNTSILKYQSGVIHIDNQNQLSFYWLGRILYSSGKKEQSIEAYKTSLYLLNKMNNKDYDTHIDIMIRTAKALTRLGQIVEAESYYKMALEYQLDTVKPYQYERHAYLLAQFAAHYTRHDLFNEAKKLLAQSLNIFEENNDSNSYEYFYCLGKSASLHKNLQEFDLALEETLILYKHTIKGPLTTAHAYNCRRIGDIYLQSHKYDLAKEYFDLAISHFNKLDIVSKSYHTTLSERGQIENDLGNYSEAINYKLKSLEIAKKLYGAITVESSYNLKTLAWAYRSSGHYEEALKYYKIILEILERTYSDDTQRLHNMLDDIAYTYHLLGDYKNADFYYQRYHQGLKTMTNELMKGYEEKDYLTVSSHFHDEVNEMSHLSFYDGYDNTKWSKQTYNNLLRLRSIYIFNKKHDKSLTQDITHIDIANKLMQNQVALEFFDFDHYDDNCKTVSVLIQNNESHAPISVTLFQIDGYGNIYDLEKPGKTIELDTLKSIIAEKISDNIKMRNPKFYFAISETLHELAIDLSRLPFKYNQATFHHLFSTRSILDLEKSNATSGNYIYAIGNVDYTTQADSLRMCHQSWSDLIYDEIEIEKIHEYCTSSIHYDSKIIQSSQAQEKNITSDLKSRPHDIIHFATHGIFNIDLDDSPLGQCGLVLNDVDLCCDNKLDNGILSGLEIKNINLKETDLVVLSSCYSGKGDIKYLEGIFGLQRAFKMAGAKNIIYSLEAVSDLYSMKFMNSFYNNLIIKEKSIHDAFYLTQNELTENEREKLSFILIES